MLKLAIVTLFIDFPITLRFDVWLASGALLLRLMPFSSSVELKKHRQLFLQLTKDVTKHPWLTVEVLDP